MSTLKQYVVNGRMVCMYMMLFWSYRPLKALSKTNQHSPILTLVGYHASHLEQFGGLYVAQGHFQMSTGKAGDQTREQMNNIKRSIEDLSNEL